MKLNSKQLDLWQSIISYFNIGYKKRDDFRLDNIILTWEYIKVSTTKYIMTPTIDIPKINKFLVGYESMMRNNKFIFENIFDSNEAKWKIEEEILKSL